MGTIDKTFETLLWICWLLTFLPVDLPAISDADLISDLQNRPGLSQPGRFRWPHHARTEVEIRGDAMDLHGFLMADEIGSFRRCWIHQAGPSGHHILIMLVSCQMEMCQDNKNQTYD